MSPRTAVARYGRKGLLTLLLATLLFAWLAAPLASAQEEAPGVPGAADQPAAEQAAPEEAAAEPAVGRPQKPYEKVEGLYLNIWWLLLFAASVLFWLWVTSWVSVDSRGVGLDHPVWTAIFMGVGFLGLIGPMLVHGAFSFLLIVMVGGAWGVYVTQRNKRVPARHRLLGAYHRAQLLSSVPLLGGMVDAEAALETTASGAPIENEDGESIDVVAERQPTLSQGVNVLADLVTRAYSTQSTRVRLYPGEEDQYVSQFKMDGVLHNVESFGAEVGQQALASASLLLNIAEEGKIRQGAGRLYSDFAGDKRREINARIVSAKGKPALVLDFPDWTRNLHKNGLESLGVHPAVKKRIQAAVGQDVGSLIVSGEPRSGRTTTMYAAAREIDIFTTELIALEQEHEYDLEGVRLWDYGQDQPFDEAYTALLREGPEAIMLDEVGTPTQGERALTFAAGDGLLLTTLEAQDAASALLKLKEMTGDAALVARAVTCVTCQRLARRLCVACKEEVEPNPALVKKLKLDPESPGTWFRPVGCNECLRSGYRGQVALYEMLIITEPIGEALASPEATAADLRAAAGESALRSMYQDGLTKVTSGVTTLEEIRRVLKSGGRTRRQKAGEKE